MYLNYFGLNAKPFSIAPDPEYLFMSERHREALAHLVYGIQADGGFVLLSGEVGTGKTTVCRCLLNQVPEATEIAYILNPRLQVDELLATLCDELGISVPAGNHSIKVFIDALNHFLLETHGRGHKTVVIIDEAQQLSSEVLEQLRLLTNLETNKQKLLQIILLGQPELNEILARPELRQLAQRITARYHLTPLSRQETGDYVRHRLAVAGVERPLFPAPTLTKLYRLSAGIPRLINLLCDRALLGAYVNDQNTVSVKVLSSAAREIFGSAPQRTAAMPARRWPLLLAVALFSASLAFFMPALLAERWPDLLSDRPLPQSPSVKTAPTATIVPTAAHSAADATPPATLRWPSPLTSEQNQQLAYRQLLQLWGYDYQPTSSSTAIDYAQQHGLRALHRRGSLGSLRQLDRPAILHLHDENHQTFYATLSALDDSAATLLIGDTIHNLPPLALMKQWQGEFILFWQPPPMYQSALRPGARGALVGWLEQQLAQLQQRPASLNPEPKLDGTLLKEVQAFQLAHGLSADGIVGPLTLIHLGNALGSSDPRLTSPEKD